MHTNNKRQYFKQFFGNHLSRLIWARFVVKVLIKFAKSLVTHFVTQRWSKKVPPYFTDSLRYTSSVKYLTYKKQITDNCSFFGRKLPDIKICMQREAKK